MDETYCAFCGVCFGIATELYHDRLADEEVEWTPYFRALRQRSGEDSVNRWYLSGVGIDTEWGARCPPDGYDAREHVNEDDREEDPAEVGDEVIAYGKRGTDKEVVFPIHPVCWQIFVQAHALLARETASAPDLNLLGDYLASQEVEQDGRGLRPSWTDDYGGPEQFWADGWREHPEPEASEVAGILDYTEEWDFLVKDPDNTKGLDAILQSPPLRTTDRQTTLPVKPTSNTACPFSRIPEELRLQILTLLPTPSIPSIRLASRSMAVIPLTRSFWRSRFAYPNELSHLTLLPNLLPGHEGRQEIDWIELRRRLLQASHESDECMKNRHRIFELSRRLVHVLARKASAALEEDRKTPIHVEDLVCLQSFATPGSRIKRHASVVFHRHPELGDLKEIRVFFHTRRSKRLLSGLTFSGALATQTFGSCKGDAGLVVALSPHSEIRSITVAMSTEGIVGLRITVYVDGTVIRHQEPDLDGLSGQIAMGRLCPVNGDPIAGVDVGLSQHGELLSLGILEKEQTWAAAQAEKTSVLPTLQNALWHPKVPPIEMRAVAAPSGERHDAKFSYLNHTIFAQESGAAEHLIRVSVFIDIPPFQLGVKGFQFHFDDRESIPPPFSIPGKEVSMLIDGPGGETISGIDVLRSGTAKYAGLKLLTSKGRQAVFATAQALNDVRPERLATLPGTSTAGIFGEVVIADGHARAYQNFGLLCAPYPGPPTPLQTLPSYKDDLQFDDHCNVWTDDTLPPGLFFGQAIGVQPTHGFINWFDFKRPSKRITVCVVRPQNTRGEISSPVLKGLKVDFSDGASTLLGRCADLGEHFDLEGEDVIEEVVIGITKTRYKTLQGIWFITAKGLCKGFVGDSLSEQPDQNLSNVSLTSKNGMILRGLAWSFDLGQSSSGDSGIQPIYSARDRSELLRTLYPSLDWTRAPASHIQLRPTPSAKTSPYPFVSSQLWSDDDGIYRDTNITSIKVYFNAFLQGVQFFFLNGEQRSVGNLVGAQMTLELFEERLFAIEIEQHVQGMPEPGSAPRDTVFVNRIRFGLVKWTDGQLRTRSTAFVGPPSLFGPFQHRQRGLWYSDRGGSSTPGCFQKTTTKIHLDPGTSFAGLYAEVAPTHIHRLGVLVSNANPLSNDEARSEMQSAENTSLQAASPSEPEPIPWLGDPPGIEKLNPSPAASSPRGTYRMWCKPPRKISKVLVYRHPVGPVVVGIELFGHSNNNTTPESALLGFRTLWMEAAVTHEIEEGAHIIGFAVKKRQDQSPVPGLEDIKILTSSGQNETDGYETIVANKHTEILGFYADVHEFIESIGILQE
ncbi:MAG: hypothetical protein Q9195_008203 [Heterodermia aff. obscurata]